MLKLFPLLLILGVAAALPFLCRKPGETPKQTGICGLERTALHQGSCLCCYNNTADIPTIGIGFDLTRAGARSKMAKYNLKLEDVLADCQNATTNSCLTDKDAINLFQSVTYPELEESAEDYVTDLPPLAKAAVADVAFSGHSVLHDDANFPDFRENLQKRDFKAAAIALQKTRWCKSVPKNRCESDVRCIANHCSPGGSCHNFPRTCSPTGDDCLCLQSPFNWNICAPNFFCKDYPNCANCYSRATVCVRRGCCGDKCIPLSVVNKCPPAGFPTGQSHLAKAKMQSCMQNSDCLFGQTCEFHVAGKFCR